LRATDGALHDSQPTGHLRATDGALHEAITLFY
jgi:hypothetical protein